MTNIKARHERRRLQTPAHPCWCAIHQGRNGAKGYGHTVGDGVIALWHQVGGYTETGPWFDDAGVIVDPTITRTPAIHWAQRRFRVTKHFRALRALTRTEKKLSKQASRNPKFQSRAYLVALAGWHAAGVTVTPEGPMYQARMG